MITMTQKEYDAVTTLSNALKKYNGIITDKNFIVNIKNKSLQSKVVKSYKYLKENNKLIDFGFLEKKILTKSEKEYQSIRSTLLSLCEFYEYYPKFSFNYDELIVPVRSINKRSFEIISNMDMSVLEKIEKFASYNYTFYLKGFFNCKDYCFETRLLGFLLSCTLENKETFKEHKEVLLEHVRLNGWIGVCDCFDSEKGLIDALVYLKLPENELFKIIEDNIFYKEHDCRWRAKITTMEIEMLSLINEEKTLKLIDKNKSLFSFERFSHSEFKSFCNNIKSDFNREQYTYYFIVDKLKMDDSLVYVKKMMSQVSSECFYKINKEMFKYCKENKMDYSLYEKEIIKYELKLNSVENKKTKRRL